MHFVDRHREKIRQSPMSSRLLWACLLLVVLLVLTFGAALFLFASLHNTKKDISRSLQIQFSVFQNDMERYFDQLAVMGVNLSEDMSAEVDKELALRQMSFAQLNDSPEVLNALEEKMIEPLCRRLRQTGCSVEEPSMILLEQIFTIDKSRIERFIGYATPGNVWSASAIRPFRNAVAVAVIRSFALDCILRSSLVSSSLLNGG